MTPHDILRFWFDETPPELHFAKSAAFDTEIRVRFADVHGQAARGELFEWRENATGRLAEIIILDQFSRNLYRDTAAAFGCDGMALALAQEAVRSGADRTLQPLRRAFLYLPYMHSESARIHAVALELFSQPGLEYNLEHERMHKAIIDRFGRYPHRNAALGRTSTAEENIFLSRPGAAF